MHLATQVTRQSRRKQKILDLLESLLKLQQAKDLHISLKCPPLCPHLRTFPTLLFTL